MRKLNRKAAHKKHNNEIDCCVNHGVLLSLARLNGGWRACNSALAKRSYNGGLLENFFGSINK